MQYKVRQILTAAKFDASKRRNIHPFIVAGFEGRKEEKRYVEGPSGDERSRCSNVDHVALLLLLLLLLDAGNCNMDQGQKRGNRRILPLVRRPNCYLLIS